MNSITTEIMKKEKTYYTKAMIEDAAEFLWEEFGIAVDSCQYNWNDDKIIQEAVKKGWKFSGFESR